MENLEVRSVEIRSVDTETRTITGIAVPYGQDTNIGGYKERFVRGAFGDVEDVKLFYGHSEPIGLVTKGEDTEDGFVIEARISNTARGDEVYTLMKDKVLNRFSVGFLPVKHSMDGDVVVREKATLKEVSVVPFPAYAGATVSEVRTSDSNTNSNTKEDINNMSNENTSADVADLRASLESVEREVQILKTADPVVEGSQFRSGGELLKALATGDATAKAELRDFATTVEADVTRPGWVNTVLKLVNENRPLINAFVRAPLPQSGLTIEYAKVASTTGTVGQQATEGAALPYMEVALTTASAPVHTYGGYSSLSRQAIERTDLSYLETVLRYQALQYAKATEAAVADYVNGFAGNSSAAQLTQGSTATKWIDSVLTAAQEIDDNGVGVKAEFVVVTREVFKHLAEMVDTNGRPIFTVNGDGSNTIGNLNYRNATATIGGLPVVAVKNTGGYGAMVCSSEAFTTFESPGAPVRLADENIINLTKDFSLYGYMAVAATNDNGVFALNVDLTVA